MKKILLLLTITTLTGCISGLSAITSYDTPSGYVKDPRDLKTGPISGEVYYIKYSGQLNEYIKETRQDYVNTHNNAPQEIKDAIINGAIIIGMNEDQVIASWGDPIVYDKTITANISSEQWGYHVAKMTQQGNKIFAEGFSLDYISLGSDANVFCFMENGLLVAIHR